MPNFKMKELKENTYVLLDPGTYPAIVASASRGYVANGKNTGSEKLDLILHVDGRASVRDSLVFCESLAWKINQFAHATCLGVDGDVVSINDSNVVGLHCLVKLSHRKFVKQDRSDGVCGQVDRYIRLVVPIAEVVEPAKTVTGSATQEPVKSDYDDDVPF